MYFTLVDNDIIHLFTDLLTRLIPVNITYYIFFICNIYYILHITKFTVYTYDWRWFFRMRVGLHVFGHVIAQISGNFLKI